MGGYGYLWRKQARPPFLRCETALGACGELADRPDGWKSYARYLEWQASDGPAGKTRAYVSLSRGWALGTREFKEGLIKDHNAAPLARAWETIGAAEIRETRWRDSLQQTLSALGKTEANCAAERKSAPWKVIAAAQLKQHTDASNRWLAEKLRMGSPVAVSQYLSHYHRSCTGPDSVEILKT
jgi:hypothetical protein